MKLVKFIDGRYGLRYGNWLTGYSFQDLYSLQYRWKRDSKYFYSCCRGDYDMALDALKTLRISEDTGTPV